MIFQQFLDQNIMSLELYLTVAQSLGQTVLFLLRHIFKRQDLTFKVVNHFFPLLLQATCREMITGNGLEVTLNHLDLR